MNYSKDECRDALVRCARKYGRNFTHSEYSALGISPSASTIINKFGSWKGALEYAGLQSIQRGAKQKYTKESCRDALRRFVEQHGKITMDQYRVSSSRPTIGTIISLFGSWNAALKFAGVQQRKKRADSSQKQEQSSFRVTTALKRSEMLKAAQEAVRQFGIASAANYASKYTTNTEFRKKSISPATLFANQISWSDIVGQNVDEMCRKILLMIHTRKITAVEIAKRLKTTDRTIYRKLKTLRAAGYVIHSDRTGLWV